MAEARVRLLKPVAFAALPDTAILIPLGLVELKSRPERKVVTVRSPETDPLSAIPVFLLVIAALVKVDIAMLRPSAAVSVKPPVLASAEALTPVVPDWALMAAAICAPRATGVDALPMAPILTLLILIAPDAMVVNSVGGLSTCKATVPDQFPWKVRPSYTRTPAM